jgi:hypothetical protein
VVTVGILSVLAQAVGISLALRGTDPEIGTRAIDVALVAWIGLTAPSVAYVAWDAFTNTPQPVIMKWYWLRMTLYTGPAEAVLYVLSCPKNCGYGVAAGSGLRGSGDRHTFGDSNL